MKLRNFLFIILLLFLINPVNGENNLRERVYIQTDKQTYISGELLWIKFYLTDETGKPSSFSKIGYVELFDGSVAQVQVKLDIANGIGEGWMELPVTLTTGNYILTAYTQNMRNEDENVFFSKSIGIINTFKADAVVDADSAPDNSTFSTSENNVSVMTEKQEYTTRSQGEIHLQGLPENIHSLSVSVAGKDIISNTNNIVGWKNQLPAIAGVTLKRDFLPEYEGHIISGKYVDISTNQPLAGDLVINSLLGFAGDQIRLFGGYADNDYNVHFITPRITGTKEMAIANSTIPGKTYRVDIKSPFATHSEKTLPVLMLNPVWENQLLQRSVGLQALYSYLADSMSRVDTTYSHFQWKASRSYILSEYTRFSTMEEVVIEFIPILRFNRSGNKYSLSVLLDDNMSFSTGSVLALLDGIPITDHGIIFKYSPLLVNRIDVYRESFVFGNQRFEGMVSLTTYKNDYPGLVLDETTNLYKYEGTQVHRYFYAPSYTDDSSRNNRIPDFRHTLLWMPEVKTGGQTSFSIPFSTSDFTGDFQITVEGITKDGKVIRGTSFFKVGKT